MAKMSILSYVGSIRLFLLESVPTFTWNKLVRLSLPKILITLCLNFKIFDFGQIWPKFGQNDNFVLPGVNKTAFFGISTHFYME